VRGAKAAAVDALLLQALRGLSRSAACAIHPPAARLGPGLVGSVRFRGPTFTTVPGPTRSMNSDARHRRWCASGLPSCSRTESSPNASPPSLPREPSFAEFCSLCSRLSSSSARSRATFRASSTSRLSHLHCIRPGNPRCCHRDRARVEPFLNDKRLEAFLRRLVCA